MLLVSGRERFWDSVDNVGGLISSALSYLLFIWVCGLTTGVETSVDKHMQNTNSEFMSHLPRQFICYDGTNGFRGQLFRVCIFKRKI